MTTGLTVERHADVDATEHTPRCPKCRGDVWDNRRTKKNPKAPDFKCRDSSCSGVIWPESHSARRAIAINAVALADSERTTGNASKVSNSVPLAAPLQRRYVELTRFALDHVRPLYIEANVPCDGQMLAAVVATLFIASERQGHR